eukprot:COSAG05_NODE_12954_length_447_cov_1.043103_1_plen_91_part_10
MVISVRLIVHAPVYTGHPILEVTARGEQGGWGEGGAHRGREPSAHVSPPPPPAAREGSCSRTAAGVTALRPTPATPHLGYKFILLGCPVRT